MQDLSEFGRTLLWYGQRKLAVAGMVFETGKGLVVEVLKARRGTYQKPFLHVGMIFLTATAMLSAPIIVNSYPTSASSSLISSQTPPSAVLNAATDATNVDTVTIESEKPRRDVVDYIVQPGDTLSSIAKKYSGTNNPMDVDSIAYLNNIADTATLRPGDTIKIPPVAGVIVTVKSGDTIDSLAKKYGLASAQPIVDWPYNTFVNDETFSLAAGQTIVIPSGKPPAAAPAPVFSTPSVSLFAQGSGVLAWPTQGIITQYFSWYHNGVDIANNIGTPVYAADSGIVESVIIEEHDYGHHIIINHGNGLRTLYGHLSEIWVSVGQSVVRGQQIGRMGSTGRSTGPHLHFTVYSGPGIAALNPLTLLK
ncbi:MAG: M23 family metallopeptidase [Patescibacteria group bacterium]|nr:M23 family metallopeptidase [Patescibacteria group bacterium]